ncbi:HAD-IIIC family phosphatase [Amycolatopsis balhimycina DSM 5908]|uniref:HAD-IIIC family phosphatase n=1 Tax=Amycolatopsis balhimycina DSM 5908 TaxID=1081091 RepID=A0A428WTP7_AMYBA|nr:HAD-IIIC family phosphatase [Amycolatopsis balhimycina DSM 5908]
METVKCLVWDLDDTLWRGTLAEGDDVALLPGVADVVRGLDARGILQSVASRNDPQPAMARLAAFGLDGYFVLPQIGWGRKSDAVRAVAGELGFAHRAMAFVDDRPAELAEVSFELPEVRTYPAAAATKLLQRPEFTPAAITDDARHRRERYQAGFRRDSARAEFAGPDDEFLRSLGIVLRIDHATETDLARLEELTRRTSQMNATGVPYSEAALRGLLGEPDHDVLVLTLTDRFGPSGAVGLALVHRHPRVWHLKLLATSCRVVGCGVGAVALRWLADRAAAADVHLVADFRRTDRNRIMEIGYRFAGFSPAGCACAAVLAGHEDTGIERFHLVPRAQPASAVMTVLGPKWTVAS